jgi:undecaprenyl phosphate N,N'-diacetylbacillosamine 1-phosphate transferase
LNTMYKKLFKRFFDLFTVAVLAIFILPAFLCLALCVRIGIGSPIFFRQMRRGLNGKPFMLWKFRTMTNKCDEAGHLLPDSARLTALGRSLRKFSLDELPELINVFKGDMSLVGPRPWLMRYYAYFKENERIRFSVRPGITGLAQVSGRNSLSWDARIALDLEYIGKCSLSTDLHILILTLWKCVSQEGLHVDPGTVMADFDEERKRLFKDGK